MDAHTPEKPTRGHHELPLHNEFIVHSDTPWYRQKFFWMIILSIIVSIIMTAVSLRLYVTSGTAQLDLSRPGYESVRADLEKDDIQSFSGIGVITDETMEKFTELYDEQNEKTKSTQFSSNALSNKAMGLPEISDGN